jgi:SAM-dependent methyltransferase
MSCPVCGGAGPFPVVERHGRFVLHLCPGCDVQFADPMEEAGRDFYEGHELYCGPETLFTSPRLLNWDQRMFLRDRPSAGGALLDVGCGAGQFAEAARRAGYRVTGLDQSRSQLDLARRRFPLVAFHPATLADFAPAAGRTFDVITAFQVLEHVARPVAFVAEARRLLAPGGYFAVGVPAWRAWKALREPLDAPPNHLTRWSRASLVGALERGGFEVLRVREHRSVYGFLLRHLRLGLLRRLMRRAARSGTAGTASPGAAVLGLSIAKARVLAAVDVPAGALLGMLRAPGVTLYALARVKR